MVSTGEQYSSGIIYSFNDGMVLKVVHYSVADPIFTDSNHEARIISISSES